MLFIRLYINRHHHSLIPIVLSLLLLTNLESGSRNIAALQTVRQVEATPACSVGGTGMMWQGGPLHPSATPLLQAVAYAALAPDTSLPPLTLWQRNTNIYHWLHSQGLIQRGQFKESLAALQRAESAALLRAAGHKYYTHERFDCALINWELVHEVTLPGVELDPSRSNLDDYRQSLYDLGQPDAVVHSFEQLLAFDPENLAWRLHLGEALIWVDKRQQAEGVLAPLLNSSYKDTVEALLAQP